MLYFRHNIKTIHADNWYRMPIIPLKIPKNYMICIWVKLIVFFSSAKRIGLITPLSVPFT